MNPIERNRSTALRFLAGTHAADPAGLDVIDETVCGDIVCHGFPGGNPVDRESYKAFFRDFRQAFSDMDFHVESLVADAAQVAARWRMSITHSGTFAGTAPTGRRVTVEGFVLYRMADGLIAETWLQLDQLGLLARIGALPISGNHQAKEANA